MLESHCQPSMKSRAVIQSQRPVTFPTGNTDRTFHINTKHQWPFVIFFLLKIFYPDHHAIFGRCVNSDHFRHRFRLSSPRLLWFLRIPAWRQRLLYFSETAVLDATQKVGVGCPPELCLPVMGAAAEQSTRCHCSSTANCLLEHFLG